ncbi:MAG TPA: hypothetical protein VH080_08765 [Gemmatimonadaceae bacterium]|jgi:hypothetical protein|nr:hypothetical protein [Gemmatimonadaceae bacterium]
MRKRLLGLVGVALVASAVIAGCADRAPSAPLSPAATQPSNSLLGGLIGGVLGTVGKLLNIVVTLVTRPTTLQQDVVWSFDAGPGGTVSANRTAGLSITVPPGALSQTTHITVTVKAGNVYNYQFQPEGLQFAVPVVVTQDVSNNSLIGSLLGGLLGSNKVAKGAYYSAPTLQYDPKTGQATVNELEPTITGAGLVSFQIKHFSGYTIAMCDNGGF